MNKRNYAFGRTNFIMLAIGFCIVIIGYILMSCAPSTEAKFNPEIFAPIHIKVAPVVCFLGYISMIFGVLYRPKKEQLVEETSADQTPATAETKATEKVNTANPDVQEARKGSLA